MLLRRRSRKGNAPPRPPRVPHRCQPAQPPHRVFPPGGPLACITGLRDRSTERPSWQRGGGPWLPPGLPPSQGGEWPPFRVAVAVAGRAGGLNGACEPSLGGRPALISPALLRRAPRPRSDVGAGARPAAPRATSRSSGPLSPPGGSPEGVPGASVARLSHGAEGGTTRGWSWGDAAPVQRGVHVGWKAWAGAGVRLKPCGVTSGALWSCDGGVFGGGTAPQRLQCRHRAVPAPGGVSPHPKPITLWKPAPTR